MRVITQYSIKTPTPFSYCRVNVIFASWSTQVLMSLANQALLWNGNAASVQIRFVTSKTIMCWNCGKPSVTQQSLIYTNGRIYGDYKYP